MYRKVEEDTQVDEVYDRLGNKLYRTYRRYQLNEPGIEIFDKNGTKLDGAYIKAELIPKEEM